MNSDHILITRSAKGDMQAFAEFVDKYSRYVFNLAYRVLKDHQDAEEAAQDTFVKVFHALDDYRGDGKVTTWLYTITYRNCLNRMRSNRLHVVEVEDQVREGKADSTYVSGLESLERADRSELIRRGMEQLSSKESAVLTLFYLEEQSLKEISEIMGLTSSNAKVILHRGRKNLYHILRSQQEEPLTEWI